MLRSFSYYQPTRIHFGFGKLEEVGRIVSRYGKRALLVTVPPFPALEPVFEKTKRLLRKSGVEVAHFDQVIPNPTTESISRGAEMARDFRADVVVGLGGGSSIDTAKAIALEVTHEGTAWEYHLFGERKVTREILPIIAIPTTSGTGSQVTAVSVLTNPKERFKSAIVDPLLFPKEAIVDPDLVMTLPQHLTASTGFDAFAHAFESYIHVNANPYTDLLALEAIRLIVRFLPPLLCDLSNREARAQMAWADTLAGLSIANCGTTLPHGIAMSIGGKAPWVMHGEALSVVYPEFIQRTAPYALERFAAIARIFRPELSQEKDEIAAQELGDIMVSFLKEIGMWFGLEDLRIPREELPEIAEYTFKLPDYTVNPWVPTKEEVLSPLESAYSRD
ncbi:iron-containing alcohol dehydrogenase [Candidatus Caldatribacterium saccharofermentans]|uniref:iron-containing alcohol dehydrogenase n=1 Tax=Candidatus Caldatribacterium saccharofermentans TaxID=1454753 RepID=UPI003CFBEE7E